MKIVIGHEQNTPKWTFYALMSLFWLTLIFRNYFDIGIPVFVFLVYALAISLLGDHNEMIALAVSCIPLSTSLQYKYVLLIIIFVYLLKYYKEFTHFPPWALFGVLIMLWEFLHFATLDFSIVEYLRGFTELLFCMLLFASSFRDYDYSMIRTTLAISTIVVTGIIFLNILKSGASLDEAFSSYYRFGEFENVTDRSFSGLFNPNDLGFICNLSIVGLLQEIYLKKRPLLNLIMISILTLCGILTLSRTFLVCFVVVILLFTWAKTRERNRGRNLLRSIGILILIISLVFGAFYLFTQLFPSAYSQLMNRFEVSDLSGGRIELLRFFNQHIFSSFKNAMFGIGLQNAAGKIAELYNRDIVPHNGIQEVLLVWGFPGLILVIGWFWSFIRGARRYNPRCFTVMNLLPLIFFVLKTQSGQFFRSGKNLLAVALAFISLCQIITPEESADSEISAESVDTQQKD